MLQRRRPLWCTRRSAWERWREHTDHLLLVLGASEGCAQDALLWAKLGASLDHWSDGRGQLLLPPGFAADAGQGLEASGLRGAPQPLG